MKYHSILLITLLIGVALAFPVPDEEVSSGSVAAAEGHIGEIKSEAAADKPALKTALTEETKTKAEPVQEKQQESKKIEEDTKAKVENVKLEEKQPLLALGAPDSELPQNLPELQKQATEIKEKEKNIRSENLATEELKSRPSGVFETPVVVPSAVEKQQQIIEEEKPVLQVILPEGKIAAASSAAAAAAIATEEKEPLEEKIIATADAALPSSAVATDAAPLATDDNVASAAVDESKKVDLTGRQERGGNEAKKESESIISEVPASAPAETIKDDASAPKALEPLAAAEKLPAPAASAAADAAAAPSTEIDLKPKIENTPEELKSAPVGDIEKQAQSLDEIIKNKDNAAIILPEVKETETDAAKEASVNNSDTTVNETVKPSEPKDSSEEKKDSIESKESAESDESKAKSEENVSN